MQQLTRKGRVWNWTEFHHWADREKIKVVPEALVGKGKKIFGIGSCFAENVITYLQTKGVEAEFFPGGNRFYDPLSIEQTLRHLFEEPVYSEQDIWKVDNDEYGNPFRDPYKRFPSVKELWDDDREINRKAKLLFTTADVIIVTFGGTEIWRNPQSKLVYLTIPFPDVFNSQMPEIAEFHNLSLYEIDNSINNIVQIIKKHNSAAQIILTVSPNRMTFTTSRKDVTQATCQGKSALRATVGEICDDSLGNPRYFHSYELIEYSETPALLYEGGFGHVSAFGIQVVMNEFCFLYGDESIRNEKEYEKIKALTRDGSPSRISAHEDSMDTEQLKLRAKRKIKKILKTIASRSFR